MRLILLFMMRLNLIKAPECILCVNLLQSNHGLNEIASLICEGKPCMKMRLLMDRVSPSVYQKIQMATLELIIFSKLQI